MLIINTHWHNRWIYLEKKGRMKGAKKKEKTEDALSKYVELQ